MVLCIYVGHLRDLKCRDLNANMRDRIDRLVSGVLDVPMSLSDSYITTKLYEETAEAPCPLPWLADCPNSENLELLPNLGAFAHVCQIRFIQSKILNKIHSAHLEDPASDSWQKELLGEITEWSAASGAHLQKSVFEYVIFGKP